MTIIALLTEFQCGRIPGKSGPGDILRLAHALRHPEFQNKKVKLLSSMPASFVRDLFKGCEIIDMKLSEKTRTGCVDPDELERLLEAHAGNDLDGAEIIHPFIGREDDWLFRGPGKSGKEQRTKSGKTFCRKRIDSGHPTQRKTGERHSYMFHGRWDPLDQRCSKNNVIAAYIRDIETGKSRNVPNQYPTWIREVADANGFKILWAGDSKDLKLRDGFGEDKLLYEKGGKLMSLGDQIREVSERASAAVGWNSGGLDIAAAGAVPILRVGEFQTDKNWGKYYNSYLSCASSVGMGADSQNTTDIDETLFKQSLDSFLKNLDLMSSPRHITLPTDEPLSQDRGKLKEQLNCKSNQGFPFD